MPEPLLQKCDCRLPVPGAVLCEVHVRDLEVLADIGAMAMEVGNPQPLKIHVVLGLSLLPADGLDHTFDYNEINRIACDLAAKRITLVETFALQLASRCLAHPLVARVEVAIDKPRAIPGCNAGARVVLTDCQVDHVGRSTYPAAHPLL